MDNGKGWFRVTGMVGAPYYVFAETELQARMRAGMACLTALPCPEEEAQTYLLKLTPSTKGSS